MLDPGGEGALGALGALAARGARAARRGARGAAPYALSFAAVAWIPPAHIAVLKHFWRRYSLRVNKRHCSCSCWDTVFKGPYETSIAEYKHFYFNATEDFLKIWLLLLVFLFLLYECTRWLLTLAFNSQLRYEMFLLYATSVFSHYYAWWAYVNYYNDEFYGQWYHQLFFTITELMSTAMIMHLANERNSITAGKALVVVGIAMLHIIAGGWDQFYSNVIRGEGRMHQIVRDICFMVPDILNMVVPLLSFTSTTKKPLRLTLTLVVQLTLTLAFISCGFWMAAQL